MSEECPKGSYCPLSSSTPVKCPAGNYSATNGATRCIACSLGTFSTTIGADSSNTCLVCPANSYCPDSTRAIPCANGAFSSPGSTSASTCTPVSCAMFSSSGYACAAGSLSSRIEKEVLAASVVIPLIFLAACGGIVWYAWRASADYLPGAVLQQQDSKPPPPLPFASRVSHYLLAGSCLGAATLILTLATLGLPYVALNGPTYSAWSGYFSSLLGICGGGCVILTETPTGAISRALRASGVLVILCAVASAASTVLAAVGGKAVRLASTLPFRPSRALSLAHAVVLAWAAAGLLFIAFIPPLIIGSLDGSLEDTAILSLGKVLPVGRVIQGIALVACIAHAALLTVAGLESAAGGAPLALGASSLAPYAAWCGYAISDRAIAIGLMGGMASSSQDAEWGINPVFSQPLPRPGETRLVHFAPGPLGLSFAGRGGAWQVLESKGQAAKLCILQGDEVVSVVTGGAAEAPSSAGAPAGAQGVPVLSPPLTGPVTLLIKFSWGPAQSVERGEAAYTSACPHWQPTPQPFPPRPLSLSRALSHSPHHPPHSMHRMRGSATGFCCEESRPSEGMGDCNHGLKHSLVHLRGAARDEECCFLEGG